MSVENNECVKMNERVIIIDNHADNSHRIKYYYGCYDPLQYPLLFPYGDTSWHKRLEKFAKTIHKDDLISDLGTITSAEDIIRKEEKG